MRTPERTVTRIARAGLWLLVTALLTAALLPASAAGAYDPQTALRPSDQDPTTLGVPEIQMAPQRPPQPEPLPPGTGFIPPSMDLSHLDGQRMPGTAAPQALPSAWDWRAMGMVTPVRDQGTCGSCYAFGSLANFESKMLMDGAGTFNFSENHAKECNWRELNNYQSPNPGDYWGSCDGGNSYMLASLFSQSGTVLESCDPYVAADVNCSSSCPYAKTLLDWRIISAGTIPDPEVLKQYIYEHGPVTASMYADSSQGYNSTYNGSYTFNYTTPGDSTNHSVLIVGWSNDLPSAPGGTGPADGWIVKNSWGTEWGDSGYFYVTYGAANMATYASYVHAWQDYDAGGDIWVYDDDGWSTAYGYGTTTAWALARFIPDGNTYATRVEFWTTDATTDLDVYLYDDFDGVTRSNLLTSELNGFFSEAGYHSVALTSPVPLTSGDDIIVVVKFTNLIDTYPIAADPNGTIETGRTYLSSTGSGWIDMGAGYDVDIAIRLRTSAGSDGTVALTKSIINDDGGTLSEADFQPYLDGSPVSWDSPVSLSPGAHVVSETGSAGYSTSEWGGDCEIDGTLAVAPGGAHTCTVTNNDIAPSVTLTKTVVNDDGGTRTEGDFQAYLDGAPISWEAPIAVLSGTHTVSEAQVQGYAASAWGGDCETNGTLTTQVGGTYTCTVTNNDMAASLTLTKTVINDSGGTLSKDDFQPYLDSEPLSWETLVTLSAGAHTVSEAHVSGYGASSWGGDCAGDGALTAELGVTYTCTITNDDISPTLTLTKTVVNDDGGTLSENDFQPHLDGSPVSWDTTMSLEPGAHTISETEGTGYQASAWGGDCASDGTLTADIGGTYSCTVTNDDVAPALTLTKSVVNHYGGTLTELDFPATIGSSPANWGVRYELGAGSYLVKEDLQNGYAASSWSGDCAPNGSVSLEIGDDKTCYITNDDIAPTVTLTKTVVNNDGGTLSQDGFHAYVDGSPASWGDPVTLISGTHSVSETQAVGYAASSWAGDCEADGTLTAQVGGIYTCSVTNDDAYEAPVVMLSKTVSNDDGGTSTEGDFQPYLDGNPVPWDTPVAVLLGTHTVSEAQMLGYAASAWGGDCEPDGALTALPAGVYTCTVTNYDIAPTLALTKTVVNDGGGTLSEDDFQPYVNGIRVSWGAPVTLLAGRHTISETQALGYATSGWGGDCEADGTLTAGVGGVYTCTITNSDMAPTVTLSKTVVNDDGGTLLEEDFQPSIDGTTVPWDTPVVVLSGTHTVSETGAPGYAASSWGGDCESDGTLTVELGGAYTCSVTNDDRAGSVTLVKTVVNDNGGTLSEGAFHPYLDGSAVSWDVPVPLAAGTHTVSETEISGYAASSWDGDCAEDGELMVDLGGMYTCTVTNNDLEPTVTLTKTVLNDNGGTLGLSDFQPYLNGSPVSWDVTVSLFPGLHTVSETQVSGYVASTWGGDCTADGSLMADLGGTYICTVTNDDIGPAVTSITPNSGVNTDTVRITDLAGSNFQPGATVALVKAGQFSLPGTGVHVESVAKITCDLNLHGIATGWWSVAVTNPDSRVGVLPEGFMVYPPGGPRFVYLPLVMRR